MTTTNTRTRVYHVERDCISGDPLILSEYPWASERTWQIRTTRDGAGALRVRAWHKRRGEVSLDHPRVPAFVREAGGVIRQRHQPATGALRV